MKVINLLLYVKLFKKVRNDCTMIDLREKVDMERALVVGVIGWILMVGFDVVVGKSL